MAEPGLLNLSDSWRGRPDAWRPARAMVLAAGRGLRMRPITDRLPKPLIRVGGVPLIDRALDRLADAGVEDAIVNLHHLGHLVEGHLKRRTHPRIVFSPEPELLETGGGVKRALPLLGPEPFYVVNSDVLWLDGPIAALGRLARAWTDSEMDGLLLLHSTVTAWGYQGTGDFVVDPAGRLSRRPERMVTPYLFTGIQILHPRLFKDVADDVFSLNSVYDRAIENGRLMGVVHDGEWFDVGNPTGLDEAEAFLKAPFPGRQWL